MMTSYSSCWGQQCVLWKSSCSRYWLKNESVNSASCCLQAAFTPNLTLQWKRRISNSFSIGPPVVQLRRPSTLSGAPMTFAWSGVQLSSFVATSQLPITYLGDLTPMRHSKLHNSAPHSASCYVNYVRPSCRTIVAQPSLLSSQCCSLRVKTQDETILFSSTNGWLAWTFEVNDWTVFVCSFTAPTAAC